MGHSYYIEGEGADYYTTFKDSSPGPSIDLDILELLLGKQDLTERTIRAAMKKKGWLGEEVTTSLRKLWNEEFIS